MPVTAALVDFSQWINENGGVRGCMVDYQYVDGRYDGSIAASTYGTWKASDSWDQVSSIFVFGSDPLQVIGRSASDDGQVVIGVGFDAACATPQRATATVTVPKVDENFNPTTVPVSMVSPGYPYVFFQGTDHSTAARLAMQFIAQQGGKRVGFFACADEDFCTAPVEAASAYIHDGSLGSLNVGRALALPLSGTQAEYDTLVRAYLDAEVAHKQTDPAYDMVDWVWFGNTRGSAVMAAKSISTAVAEIRQAYPDFDVKVMANNWAFDEAFMNDAYYDLEGRWWGVQSFPYYDDTESEGTTPMRQVHWTYRTISGFPQGTVVMYEVVEYVYGYTAMLTWKTAAEKLVDSMGVIAAEDVRGEALKNAFETFDGASLSGLTVSPIHYVSTDHRPQDSVTVYRADDKGQPVAEETLQVSLKSDWLGW